jgi:hypothetical protein
MELKEMTEEKALKIIESAGEYMRNRAAQETEEKIEEKEVSEGADQVPFAAETADSERPEGLLEDAVSHEKS